MNSAVNNATEYYFLLFLFLKEIITTHYVGKTSIDHLPRSWKSTVAFWVQFW